MHKVIKNAIRKEINRLHEEISERYIFSTVEEMYEFLDCPDKKEQLNSMNNKLEETIEKIVTLELHEENNE